MTDAEVMTTAMMAALRFRGNFELARHFLHNSGDIPSMLGKSRFNCRVHRIQDLFLTLFRVLGETWKELNGQSIYVIDSYQIATCDSYRIRHPAAIVAKIGGDIRPAKDATFTGWKSMLRLPSMVSQ